MRFAKILSVAALPMFLFACSDSNSGNFANDPGGETPPEQPKDTIPENIPDEDLKPITRDYSLVWQGQGTVESPFLISSEQDLSALAFYVNDSSMTFKGNYFKLTADIALTKAWSPIGIYGKNAYGLGNRVFSGSFDGASKTISGLTISDTAAYAGLFGLARGARISNVVIKDAKMNVGSVAGVLAGLADSTTIENCVIDGAEIKGADRVGGLVGEAKYVTVTNISVTGSVSGSKNVGGAFGTVQDGSLTNLKNTATVSGKTIVGGVVGGSSGVSGESVITSALNYGAVSSTGDALGNGDVGGVVATLSKSNLLKSGNYGEVTAGECNKGSAGGIVAVASNKSTVNEAFNMGKVSVTKVMAVGGALGSLKSSTAANVFNQGEVAGTTAGKKMGGIVGIIDSDAKLESSYNAGLVPNENFSGAVAGDVQVLEENAAKSIVNVFFDKTLCEGCLVYANHMLNTIPSGLATTEMKAATFVTTLNGSGAVWSIDPAKFGGYPSFSWAN